MTRALPEGRVTMLFTDIERSTQLLRALGSRYADVLSDQRRIMRAAIAAHGGHEMGTEGDSFFVVFGDAEAGVAAAVDAQRGLHANRWPDGAQVRIRMGLHTGDLARHEEGYVGVDLNRAARIASTANGAQIVVSRTLLGAVPTPPRTRDLGRHRLKDLPEPEHLFQVLVDGLPEVTTPIRSLGAPSNLPSLSGPLVGRDDDIDAVDRLVAAGSGLVTLTGPGGVGKTSLAIAVAARERDEFFDGVYFVALADAHRADEGWERLAAALDVISDGPPEEAVVAAIGSRRLLVVLDNLEQVDGAGQVVATLLARTGATVLATSRGPLHVRQEREHAVAPLPLDPAAELFVQEARRVRRGFDLTPGNAAAISSICAKVGGLPLALELVASRVRMLSPARIDATLTVDTVTSRDVDRPDRQRSLDTAIKWSVDLLKPDEQEAFARLAVFAGGADLDAVAAVLGDDAEAALEALADVSLVAFTDGAGGEVRMTMLVPVQQFARRLLDTAADAPDVAQAHATHFAALAEEAESRLRGADQRVWRDRLDQEGENLGVAFQWAADEDPVIALRLASALGWLWYTSGRAAIGRLWLERAVAQNSVGDQRERAKALHALGVLRHQQGDADGAVAVLESALGLWREVEDATGIAQELNSLGVTRWSVGDLDLARALLTESADVAREHGKDPQLAAALTNLGALAVGSGDVDEAIASLEEALVLDRRSGDVWAVTVDEANLGAALIRGGRVAHGHAVLLEALAAAADLDDPDLLAAIVEGCALAAGAADYPDRVALLVGGADALRAEAGVPRAPADDALVERELGPARAALGPARYAELTLAGRQLVLDDLMAAARQPLELDQGSGTAT